MAQKKSKSMNKIKVKIQTPTEDIFNVDVFLDSTISDLIRDFYEFRGMEYEIGQVFVQLIDPINPSRTNTLKITSTFRKLGIKNGDRLLFLEGDEFSDANRTNVELI